MRTIPSPRAAEALIFSFPVWNFGYPAILKGFLDRVLLPGVSFRLVDGQVRPNLTHIQKLAAVTTYGGTRLARDLLSVHDNLERALKAADDDVRAQAGAFIEGVELTLRELINAFGKHKIEKVSPEKGE